MIDSMCDSMCGVINNMLMSLVSLAALTAFNVLMQIHS
jgi:hypothetical protein